MEQCSGFVPIHREQEQSEEVWQYVLCSPGWKCTIQCPLGTSVAIECGATYSFVQYMHKGTSKLYNLYFTVMDECNHCELMYVMLSLALFLCCALFVHIYVCDTSSSLHFCPYAQQYGIVVQLWGPSGLYTKSTFVSVSVGSYVQHVCIRWPIYYLCTLYLPT